MDIDIDIDIIIYIHVSRNTTTGNYLHNNKRTDINIIESNMIDTL